LGTLARFSSQQLMTGSVGFAGFSSHTPAKLNRQSPSKI
jgi:hypothetical protein